ncbi:hypothetical protein BH24DEI2_BH24DEI2_09140 [soil metagenome]
MKERRVYTAEFKQEAVRLCEQPGVSVVQIATELGISEHSLYKWRRWAKECGELAFPGNGKVALTVEQQENVRLRRELERIKQERDVLKKATMFFAKESK